VAYSQTSETKEQKGSSLPVIATIATAIVVVVMLVVLWRDHDSTNHQDTTTTAPAAAPVPAVEPEPAVNEGVPPRGGVAEAIADQQAPPPAVVAPPRWTIYVVASQDQATELTRALADSDAIRASMGQPSFPFRVVVLAEGVDANAALAEDESADVGRGLPPPDVIDLRSGSAEHLQR